LSFFSKKVPGTNVEKSLRETQNPCTFFGERKAIEERDRQLTGDLTYFCGFFFDRMIAFYLAFYGCTSTEYS
jgi:hypothetical protein